MTTQIKGNATSTFGGNIDVTGNVVTDAPAFHAYNSGTQAISAGTLTKIIVDTEDFDTNNCYDTSNYRFTPNVAGYYQINGKLLIAGTTHTYGFVGIYKNGSRISEGSYIAVSASESGPNVSDLIYLNGTTDYVELYGMAITTGGTATFYGNSPIQTIFSAYLARAV